MRCSTRRCGRSEEPLADNRARIWFALFVLAVFCLGGAAGFLLGRHVPPAAGWDRPSPSPFAQDERGFPPGQGPGGRRGPGPFGRGPGPGGLPPPVAERLASELRLDDAQRAQFHKTLDDHRVKFEQVHRDARGRFEQEQRELYDAIRAFLRPDQVQRFDRFMGR